MKVCKHREASCFYQRSNLTEEPFDQSELDVSASSQHLPQLKIYIYCCDYRLTSVSHE